MKYAVLGPQKRINRISDTEPKNIGEQTTVEQITDEQASSIVTGRTSTPPVFYFLIQGQLKTLQEKMALDRDSKLAEKAATMTPAEKIAFGEKYVADSGLSAARLVTLMDLLLTTKEANMLEKKPKLVTLYTWLQTVKAMSVAGNVAFPPCPHTFEEVLSE